MKNNYCIDCNKKISQYAQRCVSCRNIYIAKTYLKSKKKPKYICLKISKSIKKLFKNPKNHPNWKGGISLNKKCKCCGQKLNGYKSIRCKKCYNEYMKILFKKEKNPAYKDGRTYTKHFCKTCNQTISLTSFRNSRLCQKCYLKSLHGEANPNWKHGLSNFPYPSDFNNSLKECVRKRDNYTCRHCQKKESKLRTKLHVHHIDYNKNNCSGTNLISLCLKCHLQTNSDRDYWFAYYNCLLK